MLFVMFRGISWIVFVFVCRPLTKRKDEIGEILAKLTDIWEA